MSGLRLQIVSSLVVLSVLLSALLGVTIIKMASATVESSVESHIDTIQEAAGESMGALLVVGASEEHVDDMARHWLETGSIDGIWVFDGSGHLLARFARDEFRAVEVEPELPTAAAHRSPLGRGPGSENARFHQIPAGRGLGCVVVGTDMSRLSAPMGPVRSLVLMYLGLHVLMILVFGYFSLTLLIVRPIERLRTQAVRLGEGRFDLDLDGVRGAREMRDLAEALSQTATKLATQREALQSKITELEKARDEICAQQETIIRSEKLASVGRLAAGVAHEIGNPLSVILGFLEILESSDLPDDERREYVRRMQGEAERMNSIIKDLLAYSRPGTGELESVRPEIIAENALAILRPQKIMRAVEVDLEVEPHVPSVQATSDRLTQLLLNLLMNAAEAMVGEGRMEIRIRHDPDADEVSIIVRDDGPGIDEEMRPFLFEPFVTTKPEQQGTGLGLSVCQNIVQGFGGRLDGRNRSGGGAEFEVRLPSARGDAP